MPLNDVRRVENRIMQDSAQSHRAKATLHFLQDNMPTRMDTALARFESAKLFSLGYLAKTYMKEGLNHL